MDELASFDLTSQSAPWVIFGRGVDRAVRAQLEEVEAAGGRVVELRFDDPPDCGTVFRELFRKLEFPGYFGWNWDAVVDCLDDLPVDITGGFGVAGLILGADALVDWDRLPTLVSVLSLGAGRANSSVDLDGEAQERPAIALHFYFVLDEKSPHQVAENVEHPDLVVESRGDFVTVRLNPEVWPY
ncbi:barstar family protein [Actinosynnema sp. NPDC050436]|uniref:barstar family protein n=1 Tax=Actinosynnema sp. NPDC050436 TaxID=3155659 RepID=UPI0033C265DE